MIESIHIKKTASYSDDQQDMTGLAKHNFIYGANGTGKTTISKVIAAEDEHPDCSVVWSGGIPLETCVYNSDFVEQNFNQSPVLKGIFTLGKKDADTIEKIDAAKKEIDDLRDEYAQLKSTLNGDDGDGGKAGELQSLETLFEQQCWKLKQKYDAKFLDAFAGSRNSAANFKKRLLLESQAVIQSGLPLEELEKKAGTVFGEAPQAEIVLAPLKTETILAHEANPILKKKVIGKADVDIAALILRLGNSDWVKEGRQYYDPDSKQCPFCQQDTDKDLEDNLNAYFDDAFVTDTECIETLYSDYKSDSERLQLAVQTLLDTPSTFLNAEALRLEKDLLDAKIRINIQRIEEKKRESSKTVELDSLNNVCTTIQALIDSANAEIKIHNEMVANLGAEKKTLIKQVWKHLIENEINIDLSSYNGKKRGFTEAIDSLKQQMEDKKKIGLERKAELRALEKNTTSIQPTIDGINGLLHAFGFHGFKLEKSDEERFYKIIRSDGSDAKKTLSEGEKLLLHFFISIT
ncbi:MAG: AAA family ATPase [Pontiellaceae bacterium]|nr:AAA family ATPase [Pontiellaceae bacterium]